MIKNIQYLRFLAAALVVIAHSNLQLYGISGNLINLGGFGVDIFFIVSGFIMPYIIYGGLYNNDMRPRLSALSFMWRRIIRIWPLYFFISMTVVLVSYFIDRGLIPNATADLAYIFNGSRLDPLWIIETLTFTHWNRPPLLGIGWTHQVEFLFYAALAAVMLSRTKSPEGLEAGLLAFFLFAFGLSSHSQAASSFANPMMIEFLLGFFLYRLASRNCLLPKILAIIIVVLSIPSLILIETNGVIKISGTLYRPVTWGSIAFFLTWAALSLESYTPKIKALEYMGDASYSLYLTHGVVSPIFAYICATNGVINSAPWWLYLSAYLLTTHAIGVISYRYLENPITAKLKNLWVKNNA